jgi:membrane fusion protein (multidrug efflux system)
MDETPKPRKRRRRVVMLVLLLALLAAGAVFGIPYLRYAMDHESTDDAFIEGTVANVSFRTAGHVEVVHIRDNQRLAAGDPIADLDPQPFQVRCRIARAALAAARAKLQGMEARVPLAKESTAADEQAAAAALDVAQAELVAARTQENVARAQLDGARIDVTVAEAEAQQATAAVVAARAQAALDAADLARQRSLFERKAISRADLDRAEAAAHVSEARVDAARKAEAAAAARLQQARTRVRVAEGTLAQETAAVQRAQAAVEEAQAKRRNAASQARQVAVAEADRDEQRAEVERAAATLAQAEMELGYTKLVAPVAGRVTKNTLTRGQWVEPGAAVLALVPDEVWVVANFKETQAGHIRPGQPVTIHVDAFPDHDFHGRVDSLQAGTGSRFSLLPPENATGNYVKVVQRIPVKIVFDPLPDLARTPLAPGMSVVPEVLVTGNPPK